MWEIMQQCKNRRDGRASIADSLPSIIGTQNGGLHHLDRSLSSTNSHSSESESGKEQDSLSLECPNLFTSAGAIALDRSWLPLGTAGKKGILRSVWRLPASAPLRESDLIVVVDALSVCIDWLRDPQNIATLRGCWIIVFLIPAKAKIHPSVLRQSRILYWGSPRLISSLLLTWLPLPSRPVTPYLLCSSGKALIAASASARFSGLFRYISSQSHVVVLGGT
jgi:hypothetical protein